MSDSEYVRGYLAGFEAAVQNMDGPCWIMATLMTSDPEGVARRILREGASWIEPFVAAKLEEKERQVREAYQARASEPRAELRRGTVYALLDDEFQRVKIGFTTNIRDRMRSIGLAAGRELRLVASVDGTVRDEQEVHERLAADRQHGEWFAWTPAVRAWVAEVAA